MTEVSSLPILDTWGPYLPLSSVVRLSGWIR